MVKIIQIVSFNTKREYGMLHIIPRRYPHLTSAFPQMSNPPSLSGNSQMKDFMLLPQLANSNWPRTG